MRRLYLETSPEETKAIDKALLGNNELQRQYNELVAVKRGLDSAQLQPSESAIKNILHYAQGLQEHS
jgi:hypothetical protein